MHSEVGHQSREHILAKLREKYWVIAGSSAVRSVIKDCFICKKVQSVPQNQLMTNIPIERAAAAQPPFTNCGVDYFGPFYVNIKRSQVKRYGVIFSCLSSRAVNLKNYTLTDESLTTLFCEVENVMNSRPLTIVSSDKKNLNPITPNQLLKPKGDFADFINFSDVKNYVRKRWKYIQHLSDVFWQRWSREYLRSLQIRQFWNRREKNLKENDSHYC